MAKVLKQEKKVSPKVKASQEVSIDVQATRYKELEAKLKKNTLKMKAYADEMADLKKEIVAHANETLADEEGLEIRTEFGDLKIGKRGSSRVITDLKQAIKFMGRETFMRIAKIGLTDLDKYLTPEQVADVIEVKVNDQRRIS